MKNIIVTGGTGFIGRHLVKLLASENYNVTVITRNLKKSKNQLGNSLNLIECNLNDINKLKIDNIKCDVFYNLAWDGVSSEFKDNIDMQLKNIEMTLKIAEFAKNINTGLFISAGTVAEYVFCEETMDVYEKQTPNDMYGASKVAAHFLLDVYTRNNNLPFIWCIIPSAFGEGRTDNNILSYTIRELLAGRKPKYGSLTQMWDFLYVKEIVRALKLIGEKGQSGKIYGIGSGVYKPLREYIEIIRDAINPNLPLGIGERPELSQKTFSSCVNINELTKDTGFVPQIYFEEGIKRTIEWFKMNNK
jgi:nucleoside-diphosphate-sugar epimerase